MYLYITLYYTLLSIVQLYTDHNNNPKPRSFLHFLLSVENANQFGCPIRTKYLHNFDNPQGISELAAESLNFVLSAARSQSTWSTE